MRVSSSMPGAVKGFLVPADGGLGHAFVEEALRQPGVGLHDLQEGMSAIDGLAGLLQLADGFVEQAHFAEGDAKVVVSFGIFFDCGGASFEILFQFAKHFREIDAGVLAEGRRLGDGRRAGNERRDCAAWGSGGRGDCADRGRGLRTKLSEQPEDAAAAAALAAAGSADGGRAQRLRAIVRGRCRDWRLGFRRNRGLRRGRRHGFGNGAPFRKSSPREASRSATNSPMTSVCGTPKVVGVALPTGSSSG